MSQSSGVEGRSPSDVTAEGAGRDGFVAPTHDELTIRELVVLRLMLSDALQRARAAARYTRGAAIVSLDATVERANYLVVQREGLNPSPKASFGDIHSSIRAALAGTWNPGTWPLINKLHLERDKVQHQGLEPDRDQLPIWTQAVETYVVSLIQAEYGVDIRRVVVADAIDDPDLAGPLRRADESREAGDVAASVQASLTAFDDAVARWTRMHAVQGRPHRSSISSDIGLFSTQRDHEEAFKHLNRLDAERSFAPDPAEHQWFRAARREPVDVLDDDDADRILAFVFSWIASFEIAAREWAPDRRHRAAVAARQERADPRPAKVDRIASVDLRAGRYEVAFGLTDLPSEDAFDRWSTVLRSLLQSGAGDDGSWWRVNQDGTVNLSTSDQPGAAQLNALEDAVRQVEETITREDLEAEHRQTKLREQKQLADSAIDEVRDRWPHWVLAVSWTTDQPLTGAPAWVLSVHEIDDLPRASPGEAVRSFKMDLADHLRQAEPVTQCWIGAEGQLVLEPALNVPQLLDVFSSVDDVVAEYLSRIDRYQEQRRVALAQISADLARALSLRSE